MLQREKRLHDNPPEATGGSYFKEDNKILQTDVDCMYVTKIACMLRRLHARQVDEFEFIWSDGKRS